jgi:hypothetical protein
VIASLVLRKELLIMYCALVLALILVLLPFSIPIFLGALKIVLKVLYYRFHTDLFVIHELSYRIILFCIFIIVRIKLVFMLILEFLNE